MPLFLCPYATDRGVRSADAVESEVLYVRLRASERGS